MDMGKPSLSNGISIKAESRYLDPAFVLYLEFIRPTTRNRSSDFIIVQIHLGFSSARAEGLDKPRPDLMSQNGECPTGPAG